MGRASLTPHEVAEALGISPRSVVELVRQGCIPGEKAGRRRWVIDRAEFQRRFCRSCSLFPAFCARCPWWLNGLADPRTRARTA